MQPEKRKKIFKKIFCKKCYTFEKILHIKYRKKRRQKMPEKILTENGKSSADKKSSVGQMFRF